jgi:hypothetical protein
MSLPLRSILKNSTTSTNQPSATGKPVNKRHLDIAVQHATVLEHRKRVEKQVLNNIIELMEFPTSPNADPQRPTPADAQMFREYILPFQPSDYDSLIEERNIADKCGYALCPRPKGRAPSTARKQFIDTDSGPEIVDRKVLEVWCCDDCARRALYVKVQLNEEPAWLRQGGVAPPIELLIENTEEHRLALPLRPKKEAPEPTPNDPDEEDVAAAWEAQQTALSELAIERGEKPGQPTKANRALISENIKERIDSKPPVAPSKDSGDSHLAIEGHIPRSSRKTKANDDDRDSEEDDDGADWEKHLPI